MTSHGKTLLLVCLSASPSLGQYIASTQAGVGYPALTSPQPVVLSVPNSADAGLELVADRGRAVISLPFAFPFYNRQYTSLTVTANGMAFLEPSTNPADDFPSNVAIPSTIEPNGVIAPLWDDLDGNNPTSALLQQPVTGANGTQGFAIEWKDWNRRFGRYVLNFQVRLWENGVIEFFYGTMTRAGTQEMSATIGIESPTGAQGTNGLSPVALADGGTQVRCFNQSVTPAVPSLAHCSLGGPSTVNSFDPENSGTPITYIRFGPPAGVDLQPTQLRVTSIAQTPPLLQVSAELTTRNFGTVASSPFTYRLFLSQDTLFDAPERDAGVADLEIVSASPRGPFSLAPNATVKDVTTGTVQRPDAGSFYILAVVDAAEAVAETNENNNVIATSTPFFAGVDLVAEAVSGPPSTGPGENVSVTYRFTNQGFDGAGTVPFKLFFSRDAVFSTDDLLVFSGARVVQGGENVVDQVTLSLPANVPAEDYLVLLQIDDAPGPGVVSEVSKLNNTVLSRSRVRVRQADLIIERVRVARAQPPYDIAKAAFFSEPIRLEATVRNQGGASAPNVVVAFFLSDNETLNGLNDPLLCSDGPFSVGPGTSRDVVKTCTVPSQSVSSQPLGAGPYFVFAAATAAGLAETNGSNNFLSAPPLTVRGPAPNLVALSLRGPPRAAASELIAVTRSFGNNGNRPSGIVRYRFVLSANQTVTADDPVLPIVTTAGEVTERTVSLAVDEQSTATELVRIPAFVAPATWYLGVLLDPSGTVDEVDKSDNGIVGAQVQVVGQSVEVLPAALPDAVVNQPYAADVNLSGPSAPAEYRPKDAQELPPGLMFSPTGRVSGTPTRAGAYAFTVTATAAGRTVEARLGLKVARTTTSLVLNVTRLPPPARMLPYDFQLGAQGGVGPYRYTMTSGVLPEGLALSERGRLAGTPVGALGAQTTFAVSVVDLIGNTDRRVFTMTVVDASPFRITNSALPNGIVGQPFLVDIAASNANGSPVARPVAWRVAQGALPPGLTLEDTAIERIILAGEPTGVGLYTFQLEVTDALGRSDSVTYPVFVGSTAMAILGELPNSVDRGTQVSVQLTTSVTLADARFWVLDGLLPSGLQLSESGLLSGTVENDTPYRGYTFTVGYGASSARLGTIRTMRVDVEPPSSGRRQGCASISQLGALFAWLLMVHRRRRPLLRKARPRLGRP